MKFQTISSILAVATAALGAAVYPSSGVNATLHRRDNTNSITNSTVLYPRDDVSNCSSLEYSSKISNTTALYVLVDASSTAGCETNVKLFAVSSKFGKVGLANYPEGAGINYLFLTGSDSPNYIYNKCTKQIYIMLSGNYQQFLNEDNGLVQLTVASPNGEYGYVVEQGVRYLTLNGNSQGWSACKYTNDPYGYSNSMFQLAYSGNSHTQCEDITVEVDY